MLLCELAADKDFRVFRSKSLPSHERIQTSDRFWRDSHILKFPAKSLLELQRLIAEDVFGTKPLDLISLHDDPDVLRKASQRGLSAGKVIVGRLAEFCRKAYQTHEIMIWSANRLGTERQLTIGITGLRNEEPKSIGITLLIEEV